MYYYFIVSWDARYHFVMIYRMKNKINKNKEIKKYINMDIEMASVCQILISQITRKLCNMQKQR